MSTYERHEIVTRHVEYRVPVWADHGVAVGDVHRALAAAKQEVVKERGETATAWDDWCRIVPGDECIIIRIDLEPREGDRS